MHYDRCSRDIPSTTTHSLPHLPLAPPSPPPVANPLHLPQSTRQGVFLLLKFASVVDRPVPRLVVIEGPLCRERSSARLISCCGRMTVAGYVCIG